MSSSSSSPPVEKETKKTIVFFSIEALGHIQPILTIAKELSGRHHRALIVTLRPLSMADQLVQQGFQLHSVLASTAKPDGDDQHSKDADQQQDSQQKLAKVFAPLFQNFRLGAKRSFEATYASGGAVDKYLHDITQHHQLIADKLTSLKPDLIVIDHVVGVPCATSVARRWVRLHSAFPSVLYSALNDNYAAGIGLSAEHHELKPEEKQYELDTKRPVLEKSRLFFQQLGYPLWPHQLELLPSSPYLNFYLGPRELGLEQVAKLKPLPPTWFRLEHTLQTESNSSDSTYEIPLSIANLPGKVIYFSLGTLVSSDTQLINRLLEILAKSPNKFIVSMGQLHQHITLFPNMTGQPFLDQKAILPKVDLFLTHGGHNSIIEAFYFGAPVLVLPVFADQFDSARRIQDCHFGLQLSPYDCTQDQLLAAIDTMLANDSLRQRMKAVSSRLKSINYPKIAADKLEEVLRS